MSWLASGPRIRNRGSRSLGSASTRPQISARIPAPDPQLLCSTRRGHGPGVIGYEMIRDRGSGLPLRSPPMFPPFDVSLLPLSSSSCRKCAYIAVNAGLIMPPRGPLTPETGVRIPMALPTENTGLTLQSRPAETPMFPPSVPPHQGK